MNIEHLWQPPAGEKIVGLVQFRDHVYIATDRTVYRITEIDFGIKVDVVKADWIPPDES